MGRKILFLIGQLLLMTVIVLLAGEIGPSGKSAIWDYINVIFLNVEKAEYYERPSFDILIVLGNLIIWSLWIACLFSRISAIGEGMGYWIVTRLGSTGGYLKYTQKECFRQSVKYCLTSAACFSLAILYLNAQVYTRVSGESVRRWTELILFITKLLIVSQLFGLIGTYLLTHYPYEAILAGGIILIAVLLAADSFGCAFLRFASIALQSVSVLLIIAVYGLSCRLISIRIRKKELW